MHFYCTVGVAVGRALVNTFSLFFIETTIERVPPSQKWTYDGGHHGFIRVTFSLNYFWHLNGRWHHRSHVEQSQGSQSILRHWSGNWRYLVFIESLPKLLMKFHLISRTSYCPFVLYMRRGDKLFFAERAIFRPFSVLGECIKLEYLLSCIIYTEILGSAPCSGRAV